jgi:hypothetical protein
MQAAFRAQNPCYFTSRDGRRYRKERAYLFDFDPARTLIIYDQFANNLIRETATGGTTEEREKNIKRLLNFFPVLGEDDEGRMVELDAAQVLTIPRKLKSAEVVRHGFMSNFLFANISGIFGAAGFVREIIEKLTPAHEEGGKSDRDKLDAIGTLRLDDEGNPVPDDKIVIGKTQELFGGFAFALSDKVHTKSACICTQCTNTGTVFHSSFCASTLSLRPVSEYTNTSFDLPLSGIVPIGSTVTLSFTLS